jgi:pSer/pThr/pTyr-binding forkhead associated (FHA) protein
MPATITLKVVSEALNGAEFTYHGPGLISVGRRHDCTLHIPNDVWFHNVSRHHCLLEIDPPQVRVCDLGSRYGTYVNGELIGQRESAADVDRMAILSTPDRVLHDGDELRIGEIIFRIGIDEMEPNVARSDDPSVYQEVC